MAIHKKINREAIRIAAIRIVEEHGVASLSMRTLATELGIKAPTLYDHVKNRDEVIALVQSAGLANFGAGFAQAGTSTRDKILFYRRWAVTHRNLYPVVFQQHLHREHLEVSLEAQVLSQVVEAAGGSHIQARVFWAQLHGLVDLELHNRLPVDADLDATWEQVIAQMETAIESASH